MRVKKKIVKITIFALLLGTMFFFYQDLKQKDEEKIKNGITMVHESSTEIVNVHCETYLDSEKKEQFIYQFYSNTDAENEEYLIYQFDFNTDTDTDTEIGKIYSDQPLDFKNQDRIEIKVESDIIKYEDEKIYTVNDYSVYGLRTDTSKSLDDKNVQQEIKDSIDDIIIDRNTNRIFKLIFSLPVLLAFVNEIVELLFPEKSLKLEDLLETANTEDEEA